jgi:hypothetical protein
LSRLPTPSSTHNVAQSREKERESGKCCGAKVGSLCCHWRRKDRKLVVFVSLPPRVVAPRLKQKTKTNSGGPPVMAQGGNTKSFVTTIWFSVQFPINSTDQTQWPSSKKNGVATRQCLPQNFTVCSFRSQTFIRRRRRKTFHLFKLYFFSNGRAPWLKGTRWRARFLALKCF